MRRIAAFAASLSLLSLVAAAGEPPKQNHHCKMPDGTMDMAKTHKQCTEAKGKWTKDADAAGGGAAKTPEKAPEKAPEKTPAPAPAK